MPSSTGSFTTPIASSSAATVCASKRRQKSPPLDPTQPFMERSHQPSGRSATPADINRNGWPTSIGMPGRHRRNPQWGVLYRITRKQMVRLNLSEGVPGGMYRPTWVSVGDLDGNVVDALAYVASGGAADGRPSLRYIRLLREGARAHGLPAPWLELLDSVVPAECGCDPVAEGGGRESGAGRAPKTQGADDVYPEGKLPLRSS